MVPKERDVYVSYNHQLHLSLSEGINIVLQDIYFKNFKGLVNSYGKHLSKPSLKYVLECNGNPLECLIEDEVSKCAGSFCS